ncbi:MAG: hypothetical protein ABFE16_14735 [Armatimonadia bacterium]
MQDEYVQGGGSQCQNPTGRQNRGRQPHRMRGPWLLLSVCSGSPNPVCQADWKGRLLGTSYRKRPSDRCDALCHGCTARAAGKMLSEGISLPLVEVRAEGFTHQLFRVAASHV